MKGSRMSDGSELFEAAIQMFREGFEQGNGDQQRAELRLLLSDLSHAVKGSSLERPLNKAASALHKREDLPLETALKAVVA